MIEAAKTAHNVLVSELDKTKAELRDTKADLEDAQGTKHETYLKPNRIEHRIVLSCSQFKGKTYFRRT